MKVGLGESMSRTWSTNVLDQALKLEEGQKLIFPFSDEASLHRHRMSLIRERDRASQRLGLIAQSVNVATSTSGGFFLILTKNKDISIPLQGLIVNPDGTSEMAEPINIEVVIPHSDLKGLSPAEQELARRLELMKLEGIEGE